MKSLLLSFFILFSTAAFADKSLIIEAVKANDLETVETLLKEGANPNTRTSFLKGTTLLHITALENLPDMARLLIRYDANPNSKRWYEDDFPPLYYAVVNGHLEVVKALVEGEADIHYGDGYYLLMAYNSGNLNVADYLKSLGLK